jgi:hypothetical protein
LRRLIETSMSGVNAPGHVSGLSAKPEAAPIVFVVDDDISVRESLDALIRDEGWRPKQEVTKAHAGA